MRLLDFVFLGINNKFIDQQSSMNVNQYKMFRAKNFPLPSKPPKLPSPSQIKTIALLTPTQPHSYSIHFDESNDVVMFSSHEYVKRSFSHAIQMDKEEISTKEKKEERSPMLQKILPIIESQLEGNNRNIMILPVLNSESMNQIIFPKTGYVVPEGASSPETPDCIIKSIIQNYLASKRNNTVVSLSIMGIKGNGSLTDELDYEWLEETEDIQKAIRDKVPLKVTKEKKEVKTFDLNRQQILNWEEAKEILFHYHQLSEYLEYWRTYDDACNQCNKVGELYEISEVTVDPEDGSIENIVKKCYVLRINQYLKESNLVMMRISQALGQSINGITSKNTRDYPLMLLLNQCFNPANKYQATLFTQIGTNQTIKEQCVCLSMNLQVPGKHVYLKNYCDNKKIAEEVRALKGEDNTKIKGRRSNTVRMKEKSAKLLQESQKVAVKSFCFDTYSSFEKRRPENSQVQVRTVNEEDRGSELVEVYGSKKVQENLRSRLSHMSPTR